MDNGSDIYLDDLDDTAAITALVRQFPAWQFFRGVSHLCYARRLNTSPEWLVRGEDWTDLRDELRKELAAREAGKS